MCTVSWSGSGESWWVVFNRDETQERVPAEMPALRKTAGGVTVLSPLDPQGGGSWMGMNRCGMLVALLNDHPEGREGEGAAGLRSRGLLVMDLLEAKDRESARDRIAVELAKARYAPFHILVWDGRASFWIRQAGGETTENGSAPGFLSSSSFCPEAVLRERRREWERRGGSSAGAAEEAAEIMRMRHATDAACGLTMDREDARTVSQSIWKVGLGGVEVIYGEREREGVGFGAAKRVVWDWWGGRA